MCVRHHNIVVSSNDSETVGSSNADIGIGLAGGADAMAARSSHVLWLIVQ